MLLHSRNYFNDSWPGYKLHYDGIYQVTLPTTDLLPNIIACLEALWKITASATDIWECKIWKLPITHHEEYMIFTLKFLLLTSLWKDIIPDKKLNSDFLSIFTEKTAHRLRETLADAAEYWYTKLRKNSSDSEDTIY